jgi:beta-xylosidase
MIEAIKFWNEPNNQSHWDFHIDPEWREFAEMTKMAAQAVRRLCPELPLVLGGLSPIDTNFVKLMQSQGVLDHLMSWRCTAFRSTGTIGTSTSGLTKSPKFKPSPICRSG